MELCVRLGSVEIGKLAIEIFVDGRSDGDDSIGIKFYPNLLDVGRCFARGC